MFKKIVGLGFSSKGKNKKDVEPYIQKLVDSGATEFFTGYNPSYWSDKFGFEVSPNGRFSEHEQITDFETLKKISEEVNKHGFELFINLNAWYYTDETFPFIEKMIEEFEQIKIDGIICGNISILEYLKEKNYGGKINISTIMALYNTESIKFFLENYNINKIILSREVTLPEIEVLVKNFPKTKFEVFGEGDFCRYNNGLCFAEHKYGAKDICTVVVNDLVIKKKFSPDFKKIILNENLTNEEKYDKLGGYYINDFEKISQILEKLELGFLEKHSLEKDLLQIILKNNDRVDLYFDAKKPLNSEKNKNIVVFLRGLKHILFNNIGNQKGLQELQTELENSIQTGISYLMNQTKKFGGAGKMKADELKNFYAKADILNLYSYLFFSKFSNIETVKFPTRGRDYNEKLKIIEEVVKSGEFNKKLLDRGISLERTHYDLTYLFADKNRFRSLLLNMK